MRLTSFALRGPWAWMRIHPYTTAALAVLAALGVSFCLRRDSEWDKVYVRAADHLWRGQDIYRPQDAYLYPPFMALASLPFRSLPASVSRTAWLLINVACALALVRWAWRLPGGPPLEGRGRTRFAEHCAAVLGVLCGLPYIENCLAHQQTDVVVGALLLGGCLLLARSRALGAAGCFGVAAAMKCTPLLFAPYLAWRGRRGAAALVVVVAVAVNLLPDLVHRSPSGRPWVVEYARRYLLRLTEAGHYVGTWGSDPMYNQSLAGAGHRWFLTRLTWTATDCFAVPRSRPPHPLVLRGVTYGAALLLLALAAWAGGRPGRRADGPGGQSQIALECSAVLLLMLLLSPMSSKAHFGTLVLPGLCLARIAVMTRSRLLGGIVAGAVVLCLLSLKGPLGERLYSVSLWSGVVTWQTLLLLAGCLVGLRRQVGSAAAWPAESARPLADAA
jgi:hypothetical protein